MYHTVLRFSDKEFHSVPHLFLYFFESPVYEAVIGQQGRKEYLRNADTQQEKNLKLAKLYNNSKSKFRTIHLTSLMADTLCDRPAMFPFLRTKASLSLLPPWVGQSFEAAI